LGKKVAGSWPYFGKEIMLKSQHGKKNDHNL
jgi:hypothetical protein